MINDIFSSLPLPQRDNKPRQKGITVLLDLGIGPFQQKDIIRTAGSYVDEAKIVASVAGLLPSDVLKEKAELYREAQINMFLGGNFFEFAYNKGLVEQYFKCIKNAGLSMIEISDTLIDIRRDEKNHIIRHAIDDYGFKVMGEVGKKLKKSSLEEMVDDINSCIEAGAEKVFLEAYDIFVEQDAERIIYGLGKKVSLNKIIFELPATIFHGIHDYDRYKIMRLLNDIFGTDFNVGNVNPDELLLLEMVRRGMRTDMLERK